MEAKIKKILAREGLLFCGICLIAFIISQNITFQDWIVRTKIANPNLPAQVLRERYGMMELGEIILMRAQTIGFLSIVALYGFVRFIIWATQVLKQRSVVI